MADNTSIIKEITKILRTLTPYKAFLFGSYASKSIREDSDIDLLVILNEYGTSTNFSERLQNKKKISKRLHEIRKRIPIDLLVYTKDEWELLRKESGSSFFKKIEENGVQLI